MQSKAATVAEYLASLPADRSEAIAAVRKVLLKHLDKDFVEGMSYGMIGFCVPHSVYPAGYHCNPKQLLPFAMLTSQKQHMSLHMMGLYMGSDEEAWFVKEWKKTGKKLDMGKCCIRFKKVDDLALEVIAESLRRMPAKRYIGIYESILAGRGKGAGKAKKAAPARKAAPKRKPAARSAAAGKPRGRR